MRRSVKIVQFLLGFAPFVISMILQSAAVFAAYFVGIPVDGVGTLILFEACVWVVFGVWYYYSFAGRESFRNSISKLKMSPYIFLILAISLQYATNLWVFTAENIFSKAMKVYTDLMNSAGLGEENISLLMGFYTVVMAAVGEDLIFRGVTLKLFQRAGLKFWMANLLQAVLFGVFHFNFIQGVYAFILGMVLGYVVECYGTLWAGIVLHMCFNLAGTYLAGFLPEAEGWPGFVYALIGAAVSIWTVCHLKKKREQ